LETVFFWKSLKIPKQNLMDILNMSNIKWHKDLVNIKQQALILLLYLRGFVGYSSHTTSVGIFVYHGHNRNNCVYNHVWVGKNKETRLSKEWLRRIR